MRLGPRWLRPHRPGPATMPTLRVLICASAAALSAEPRPATAAPEPAPLRSVAAVRLTAGIVVDGQLDEGDWVRATPTGEFWQRDPHEGVTPEFPTEFRVLYDDQAIYVGVTAHDPQPSAIRGLLTRRDEVSSSDWIDIGIDSYHDRRTAFIFAVNAAGVQRDALLFNDIEEDVSWNAVWESGVSVGDAGWTAEVRIPFSQLRFSGDPEQTWGLQVQRIVQRTNERSLWTPTPKSKPQIVSLFGDVEGIRGIRPARRLEIVPYVVGGTRIAAVDAGDPFADEVSGEGSIGLDAKYGLTSSLTLSATINPDFGQVEADPSELNLTAQETFFQEKRPFFLEGIDILRFSLGQGDGDGSVETLFYTRRIGAPPHESGYSFGDYAYEEPNTSIIGAAKLSGKTRHGWSIGVMNALTAREYAQVGAPDGGRLSPTIEPFTSYSVANLKKDLNGGRTTVGAGLTAVNRKLEGTGLDWLHTSAYAGGVNMRHRFGEHGWDADLRLAGSMVNGSAEAIDRTQRASQRYFQRPDAEHLDYDPTRTSLAGLLAMGSIGRGGGDHFRFATGFDARTPGFEVNDLGFQRGADYAVNWLWSQYRDDKPGKRFNNYMVNLNTWTASTFGPEHLNVGGNVNGGGNLRNYWGGHGGIGVNLNRLDPGLLRGGPAVRANNTFNGWLSLWSDPRRMVKMNLNGNGGIAPASDSYNGSVNASITVQVRSNMDLSLGSFVSRRIDDNQYVSEAADEMGLPHWVMARIDHSTVGLTGRFNYTVSPDLSVQVYAQPFISAGSYSEYKELADPRAASYEDRYHIFSDAELSRDALVVNANRADNSGAFSWNAPDFNFRELRSNLVLRWQYLPGSTFFFIWSQGRSSFVEDGTFQLGSDAGELLRADGEHVVLVKLTYWLGL